MSTGRPVRFRWDADAGVMRPDGNWYSVQAATEFDDGEAYMLVQHEERSGRSERHYFAALREAYRNLPEEHDGRWPTELHFRKWCLVQCGYRTERHFVCKTKHEANRLAVFLRGAEPYAVLIVRDNVLIELTAESQRRRAMGAKKFQRSKDDVLAFAAEMIGRSAEDLKTNAGGAA